ncbi:DNA-directed RNA polymerases I, II, and III subunit RPABC1 [Homalodisca vitripennis]|nr:DNA-directed RNA polymerases I, II, and III subunit RPABC1 [Homalodisca vitripennis]
MGKKADLLPRKCAVAKVLLEEQHYTQTEIAHRLNISQKSVSRIKKTLDINGIYKSSRIGKCGRKKALSPRMTRKLKNMTLVNRKMISKVLSDQLRDYGTNVSPMTNRRTLNGQGLRACRPTKNKKITPAMAKKRLELAKGIQFTDDDWNKVQYPQDSVEN